VTNNVVTYETELEVENRDLSLRPGMTATADIRVAESRDVLTVPVAALRFDPGRGAPAASGERRSFVQSIIPMPPHRASSSRAEEPAEKHPSDTARVWVLRDGRPQPVEIRKGLSDARRVEVLGGDLKEGDAVILRMQNKTS
ncbi:MAG: efflux RND transporter periplasmic adaptor subunit, partial [Verrucomicrobia bacterium]